MKCPKCGGNAMYRLKKIAGRDEYISVAKCLDGCKKETPIFLNNQKEDRKSHELKKYIKNEINEYIKYKSEGKNDYPILISRVRQIRTKLGLGQVEVSKCLGVTAQRYGSIERCENNITISTLMELCLVFKVSLDDLFVIQHVSEDDYNRIKYLSLVNKKDVVQDYQAIKMKQSIIKFEEDIKKLESQPSKVEFNKAKVELKKLKEEYKDYCKKNLILKQKNIIDYSNWEKVVDYLSSK